MKITEAIKRLSDSDKHNTILLSQEDREALKLGIEALKREQENRETHPIVAIGRLPGETKE